MRTPLLLYKAIISLYHQVKAKLTKKQIRTKYLIYWAKCD